MEDGFEIIQSEKNIKNNSSIQSEKNVKDHMALIIISYLFLFFLLVVAILLRYYSIDYCSPVRHICEKKWINVTYHQSEPETNEQKILSNKICAIFISTMGESPKRLACFQNTDDCDDLTYRCHIKNINHCPNKGHICVNELLAAWYAVLILLFYITAIFHASLTAGYLYFEY